MNTAITQPILAHFFFYAGSYWCLVSMDKLLAWLQRPKGCKVKNAKVKIFPKSTLVIIEVLRNVLHAFEH